MMIKRTLTNFEITAVKLDFKNGEPVVEKLGVVNMIDTKVTTAAARKAFSVQGIDLPRGCKFDIKELESTVYGITISDFIKAAKPLEVINLSEKPE